MGPPLGPSADPGSAENQLGRMHPANPQPAQVQATEQPPPRTDSAQEPGSALPRGCATSCTPRHTVHYPPRGLPAGDRDPRARPPPATCTCGQDAVLVLGAGPALPVFLACINRGEFCKALSTSSEVKCGRGAAKQGNIKVETNENELSAKRTGRREGATESKGRGERGGKRGGWKGGRQRGSKPSAPHITAGCWKQGGISVLKPK